MSVTRSSFVDSAGFRRMVKATAIGFGVVVLSAASLGQASAQSDITSDILNDIFGEDWPFPTTATVVDEAPTQSADPGGIGEITLGGNTGGSVIMGGGSGGVSIGGGSSSSGGGGGSGNSAG